MTVLRVGIIGVGGMGRHHAHTVAAHPGAAVVAVTDADSTRAAAVAAEVGAAPCADGTALIGDPGVDAVIVASPDDTHAEYSLAALRVGKPVLCEKPLGDTVVEARAVLEAEAAEGRRLLQLGLMREYDPAHRRLAAALRSVGAIRHVRTVHRNRNDFSRTVDHALSQSLVHDVHTVRWLTRREFTSVVVRTLERPEGGLRYATVSASLGPGAIATLEYDDFGFGYDVSVEVAGDDGSLTLDPPDDPRRHDDWFGWFVEAYAAEATAWIGAAQVGSAAGPSAWDGYAAQVVIEACRASVRTGASESVDVGEAPGLYR